MTTVTVLLEDELINRLEQFTEKRHLTRDQVIRTALKSYLTSDESVLEADPLVSQRTRNLFLTQQQVCFDFT